MSIRVKSLATGSSGNVFLVQAEDTALLIDCGLPTRTIERYLREEGLDPAALAGIALTHEHTDHIKSAGVMARRYNVPIIANRPTLEAGAAALGGPVPSLALATGSCRTVGALELASFYVPHDAAEPVGYVISHQRWHICIILDAGRPSYEMRAPLRLADLVIIEANHERERLIAGPYTRLLKARILSDVGHLSNVEAAQLLAQAANGRHTWAWLAHLSEVNNTPHIAHSTVRHYLRHEGIQGVEIAVARRDRPSVSWDSDSAAWQAPLPIVHVDHLPVPDEA